MEDGKIIDNFLPTEDTPPDKIKIQIKERIIKQKIGHNKLNWLE